MHAEVTSATDQLIRRCEACCASQGPGAALCSQARKIDQQQRIANVKGKRLSHNCPKPCWDDLNSIYLEGACISFRRYH